MLPALLSPREQEAVRLVCAGVKIADIGSRMHVGYDTGREYLRRARLKYLQQGREAATILGLFRCAVEDGLVPPVLPWAWRVDEVA